MFSFTVSHVLICPPPRHWDVSATGASPSGVAPRARPEHDKHWLTEGPHDLIHILKGCWERIREGRRRAQEDCLEEVWLGQAGLAEHIQGESSTMTPVSGSLRMLTPC